MIAAYVDLARAHAPLLVVVVLLVGAALAAMSPGARLSWIVATLAACASAALAADLAWRVAVLDAQPAVAAEGLSLAADGVGVFAVALLTLTAAVAFLGASAMLDDFESRTAPFALALGLSATAGWCGAALARDFTTLFLFVEIAWIASVGFVALASHRELGALNGAARMMTAGGVGAVFLLFGAGLVERSVGAADLTAVTSERMTSPGLGAIGFAFMITALSIKAGAAPFNAWMSAAVGRTGLFAAIGVAVIAVSGAALILTRLTALAVLAPAVGGGAALVLAGLGIAAVAAGSAQAIGAANVRRLAVYAGCAQLGCVLLGMALGSPAGLESALVQILALAASQLALIVGAAGAGGNGSVRSLNGLGRRAPLSAAAVTVGALSYMGAPLTLTFLGRWRLIEAALGAGWWWAAAAAIAASLAGVFYGGRLIERIYFRHATASTAIPTRGAAAGYLLAPVLCASIAVVALGLEPAFIWRAAAHAAALMLERAP